jgi:two-component system response regulator YesN
MRHLLIVDDEPNIVEGLSYTIQEHFGDDIDVSTAYNGNNALEILSKSPIDLVITDIRMPGISGLDLLNQIHERRISCRVIVLTGYDDFSVIQEAMRKPNFVDFLLKTEGDEIIVEAVKKALRSVTEEEQKRKQIALAENHTKAVLAIDETKPALLMFARIFDGEVSTDTLIWLEEMVNHILCPHFHIEMTILGQGEAAWILQMRAGHENSFPFTSPADLSRHLRSCMYEAQSRLSGDGAEMSAVFKSAWVDPLDWADSIHRLRNVIRNIAGSRRQRIIDMALDGKTALSQNALLSGKEADVITAVHEFIEKHLGNHNLSLTDIAVANHYNPAYLSRLYKKATGMGLIDKINDMRISRACDLLKNSALKINEVADKAGYASPSYFTLYFRKKIGMTPKEYRDNYQCAEEN